MGISLKGEHLKRYKDIAALFMKYGRSDLVKNAGLEEAVDGGPVAAPSEEKLAEQLAADLEELGPTFIKLGQLLSTRADLLPPALHGGAGPAAGQGRAVPVRWRSRRSSATELGVRLSKAFSEFEREAARRGLAGPGAPRRPARRPAGRGQGAAAGHPRA